MNTSGEDDPPEISVASVARLVSVSDGAETSDTWMFGYCFSNVLISTVRASLAPVPDSGLADQTMLPEVAEPVAEDVGDPTAVEEPLAEPDAEVLEPSAPVELLPPPLEPHAANASTPVAASATPSPPRRMKTMPSRLRDITPPDECARQRAES
jgi:hypothetical protein